MLQKGKLCEVLGPLVVLILLNHFVVTLDGSWTREVSWTPIYVDTTSKLLIHFLLCVLLVDQNRLAKRIIITTLFIILCTNLVKTWAL